MPGKQFIHGRLSQPGISFYLPGFTDKPDHHLYRKVRILFLGFQQEIRNMNRQFPGLPTVLSVSWEQGIKTALAVLFKPVPDGLSGNSCPVGIWNPVCPLRLFLDFCIQPPCPWRDVDQIRYETVTKKGCFLFFPVVFHKVTPVLM